MDAGGPSQPEEQVTFSLSAAVEETDRIRRRWGRALKGIGAVLLLAAVIVYWGAPVSLDLDFKFRLLLICAAAGFLGIALWLIGDQFQSSSES
jgi:hypothetical protein